MNLSAIQTANQNPRPMSELEIEYKKFSKRIRDHFKPKKVESKKVFEFKVLRSKFKTN